MVSTKGIFLTYRRFVETAINRRLPWFRKGWVTGVQSADFGRISDTWSLIARCQWLGRNAVHK